MARIRAPVVRRVGHAQAVAGDEGQQRTCAGPGSASRGRPHPGAPAWRSRAGTAGRRAGSGPRGTGQDEVDRGQAEREDAEREVAPAAEHHAPSARTSRKTMRPSSTVPCTLSLTARSSAMSGGRSRRSSRSCGRPARRTGRAPGVGGQHARPGADRRRPPIQGRASVASRASHVPAQSWRCSYTTTSWRAASAPKDDPLVADVRGEADQRARAEHRRQQPDGPVAGGPGGPDGGRSRWPAGRARRSRGRGTRSGRCWSRPCRGCRAPARRR